MIEQSETIKELAAALVKFHGEVPSIPKNKTGKIPLKSGGSYEYKYADLSDIQKTVDPLLTKNGLTYVQMPVGVAGMVTQIIHQSGEWIRCDYEMASQQDTPQSQGSRITYQKRYALGAALGLDIDEDDDGATASTTPPKAATRPVSASKPAEPINYSGQDFSDDPLLARIGSKQATIMDGPGVGNWSGAITLTVKKIVRTGISEKTKKPYQLVDTEELGELWNNTEPLRPLAENGMYSAIVESNRITDWQL